MSSPGFPSLGVRVDAIGTEQATAKINKFGQSVGRLPKDFQAASRETRKLGLNMQKMSFAVFGASLAITSTVTSLSRLEKSALNVNRATVALERGTDLVTRKQQRLNQILRQGERFTGELSLAQSELSTAINDVIVKEEDLKIKTGEVTDTYINFAASLSASVLFSVTALFSAIRGLSLAHVKGKIAAVAHAVSIRLVRTTSFEATGAMGTMTKATVGSAAAAAVAAKAQFGLAAGLKAVTTSFAPLLIALVAITAAMVIWDQNVFGIRDSINGLLGITEETTESLDEATTAMDDFGDAMAGAAASTPQLVQSLDQIASQISIITTMAPQAAEGIRQISAAASSTGGPRGTTRTTGGGVGPGGGEAPTAGIPLGVFSNLISPQAQNINFKNTIMGQQMDAILGALDNILKKDKQISNARAQVSRILEATKNDLEAIDLIERAIIQLRIQGTETSIQQAFVLERALHIETLILQRKREQNLAAAEAVALAEKGNKVSSNNPLLEFLIATGQIGRSVSIAGRATQGRNFAQLGGGQAAGPTFGDSAFSQFLGFAGGIGSIDPSTGRQSRVRNPNFGRNLATDGGDLAAIAAFQQSSSGGFAGNSNFANPFFASGGGAGGGTILNSAQARANQGKQTAATRFTRTAAGIATTILRGPNVRRGGGRVHAGFSGSLRIDQIESDEFKRGKALADAIRLGLQLGAFTKEDVTGALGNIQALEQLARIGNSQMAGFRAATKSAAAELDLDLKFGPDITQRFGSGFGRRTIENRIDTNQEFFAAAAKVKNERERLAFRDELERIIDREARFVTHLDNTPGALRPEGTSLVLDTQPLADALVAILGGEDHKQFIKMLATFKAQ